MLFSCSMNVKWTGRKPDHSAGTEIRIVTGHVHIFPRFIMSSALRKIRETLGNLLQTCYPLPFVWLATQGQTKAQMDVSRKECLVFNLTTSLSC
jgi:hypothetical protein